MFNSNRCEVFNFSRYFTPYKRVATGPYHTDLPTRFCIYV